MATFRKRHSRKYRNKNTRRTKNRRNTRRNTRKSHINRRSRKSLVGGGILDGLGRVIPTSIQKLSKSIPMPSYFSRSDLNKQYRQLQLGKHIADILRYYRLLFQLNEELEKLESKVLRDYNSLIQEKVDRWARAYKNYVEDVNYGYYWAPAYKASIGNDYKSYNVQKHKIISEFIKIYRKFTLLLTEFKIRELELESPELESPEIASLRKKAETIKETIGNNIAPIEEDEKALFDNIEQLKIKYEYYLRSRYINLQYVYNELHPGVESSREVHNQIENEGRNLIDELKNQRKAIDKKTREFSNSRLDTVEEMISFYEATNEVWKDAMKQQDSTEATRIFKEGMKRIQKLEEDKAIAKYNPKERAHDATREAGLATAGNEVVVEAVEPGLATTGNEEAVEADGAAARKEEEARVALAREEEQRRKINEANTSHPLNEAELAKEEEERLQWLVKSGYGTGNQA